ncbi:hypothetical protein BDB00DRAFT_789799 [Zychaea mexicana]|uniref:uncharacterized protein n=1 Tax=Zychaea mexicana TaxID=64656 RepID=UPI0022FECF4F|nr:uncharacterized protein BDB00DRAFT_789799 [Zychaea mexicana]KAI9491142.1 hypothetical protein BDB00DRAFT_789799 [Zychaea mexicana]
MPIALTPYNNNSNYNSDLHDDNEEEDLDYDALNVAFNDLSPIGSDRSDSSSSGDDGATATTSQAGVVGGIVGGGAPLHRQRRFYQLDVPPWLLRTPPIIRRSSADDGVSSGSGAGGANGNDTPVGSYDDSNTTNSNNDVDLLQVPHDRSFQHHSRPQSPHHQRRIYEQHPHRHHHLQSNLSSIGTGSSSSTNSNRDPRLIRRTRSRMSPWIRHHHQHHYHHYRSYNNNNNNCVGETAVDLTRYSKKSERRSVSEHQVLDFDIVMDDGGQYRYEYDDGDDDGSSLFGVENILQNDDSVYCSGRSGTINILMQYCGSAVNNPVMADKSCVISQIVIKSPQQGFTAPCKEGLFFVSYNPIDIDSTAKFDHFTKNDYERYVRLKGGLDCLDDTDPVAWFSMSSNRQDSVHLDDRVGKYVLIKLLRAEGDSENIDLQYVAVIGYSGARAFAGARIC